MKPAKGKRLNGRFNRKIKLEFLGAGLIYAFKGGPGTRQSQVQESDPAEHRPGLPPGGVDR